MHRLLRPTQLAFHFTAPVEGAGASLYYNHFLRSIASTATHQVAAIHTYRGVVALAPVSSLDSEPGISFTEIWRLLHVDQVLGVWRLVVWIVGFQLEVISDDGRKYVRICFFNFIFKNLPINSLVVWPPRLYRVTVWTAGNVLRCLYVMTNCVLICVPQTIADEDSWSSIKSIFQIVSDYSEEWQSHPASFHCTWSRHSVAFALLTHFGLDMLQIKKALMSKILQ